MEHTHDSCTPELSRDLLVTGLIPPEEVAQMSGASVRGEPSCAPHGSASAKPASVVSPVVTVNPLNLTAEVMGRSAQIPVIVLLGSAIDPGMSVLRRELVARATSANLAWILAVVDSDRFPQVVAPFRPKALPVVIAVAGGASVAAWTPADALGDNGVDCGDWVTRIVGTVAGRLSGLPGDTITMGEVGDRGSQEVAEATGSTDIIRDPRLRQAAMSVRDGDPVAAMELYGQMLDEGPDPWERQLLLRARAAVGVLARTQGVDPTTALSTLAEVGGGEAVDLGRLLREADILVLADRAEAGVDRLSACLGQWSGEDRERLRDRILDLCLLLEPDAAVVSRARTRIASAFF